MLVRIYNNYPCPRAPHLAFRWVNKGVDRSFVLLLYTMVVYIHVGLAWSSYVIVYSL